MEATPEVRRGPLSPKKKSSFRSKLGNSVENIRENFKNARDISTRSLMDRLNDDNDGSCSSESIEEVIDLEEESSGAYDDVEYVEEVVDDSDDSSIMEPLPPPISIPKELQVKDEDKEDQSSDDSSSSDDSGPPIDTTIRPNSTRGTSFLAKEQGAKPVKKGKPLMQPTIEDVSSINEESEGEYMPPTPKEKSVSPKAAVVPCSPVANARSDPQCQLRSTGRSPTANLAKPITNSPYLQHGRMTENQSASPSRQFAKLKVDISSPAAKSSPAKQAPKSAPTVTKKAVVSPPVAGSRADDTLGDLASVEWKKPEWATRKILRDTSKGHKLMSGIDLAKPIGGIRPVEDSK